MILALYIKNYISANRPQENDEEESKHHGSTYAVSANRIQESIDKHRESDDEDIFYFNPRSVPRKKEEKKSNIQDYPWYNSTTSLLGLQNLADMETSSYLNPSPQQIEEQEMIKPKPRVNSPSSSKGI